MAANAAHRIPLSMQEERGGESQLSHQAAVKPPPSSRPAPDWQLCDQPFYSARTLPKIPGHFLTKQGHHPELLELHLHRRLRTRCGHRSRTKRHRTSTSAVVPAPSADTKNGCLPGLFW